MHRSKTRAAVAAIAAAVILVAGAAWAAAVGVVTAITPRMITVAKVAYALHEGTSFQDTTGRPISASEVRPGIAVELEFDAEGRVTVVRAAVVR